ncbi:MAG TPA: WG repeat-containing protein [Flavobacteriales bacterium]|nr:WG repeat-containing protein [Flavobacteriales bacterium]
MIHSKTIFVLIYFFCSSLLLNAQSATEKWDKYSEIAFTYYDSDNGKWVEKIVASENGYSKEAIFIDRVLKKITADFYLIRVKKKDKYGWTNTLGELLIPVEYDGGAFGAMRSKLVCAKKREKWGCIDFKNNIVVPFAYDKMSSFKDNLCQITVNGKMGFIDNKGVEVIKPVYDKTEEFSNGAAVVMKDNKYGFIDKKGTVIGSISYDGAFSFDEYKLGYVKMGAKYGVIDSVGNSVISDEFTKVPKALTSLLFRVEKNSKFGVMNRAGKLLIDYKYENIFSPRADANNGSNKESDIILRVYYGTRYGFVKADGTVLSECVFSKAGDVYMGQAQVEMHADAVTKKGTYYFDTKRFQVDVEVPDPVVVVAPGNSRSGNSSNAKAGSDTKTLKNTGKDILYYKAGSFTSSLGGGNSTSVPCRQAIYYIHDDKDGHHTVKGALISGENEDCGQTVTAVGGK